MSSSTAPRPRRIARATAEIELARLDEARLRRELARLPGLRKELAGLRRERQSRLPRVGAPSTLLESVTARAALARLEVVRFHPEAAVQAGAFHRDSHQGGAPGELPRAPGFPRPLGGVAPPAESAEPGHPGAWRRGRAYGATHRAGVGDMLRSAPGGGRSGWRRRAG